jgi:hypothetical protein
LCKVDVQAVLAQTNFWLMYGLGIYRYPIPIPSAPLEQRSHRANAARWAAALLESEFPGTLEDCLGDELVPKPEVEFEFDPTAIGRAGVDDDDRSRAGVDRPAELVWKMTAERRTL